MPKLKKQQDDELIALEKLIDAYKTIERVWYGNLREKEGARVRIAKYINHRFGNLVYIYSKK